MSYRSVLAIFLFAAACSGGRGNNTNMVDPTTGEPILDPTSDECKDGKDPNDQSSAATALTAGGSVSGLKACAGDLDFFSITLADGDNLTVHAALAAGAAPESLLLSIQEPSGKMAIAAGVPSGDGLTVTSQPGKAGTYFVRVLGVGGGKNEYGLDAQVSPNTLSCGSGTHAQNGECVKDGCEDFGLEPNDDLAGGRHIIAGTYTGLKSCAGDDDHFVLRAPPGGGALQVKVTNIVGGDVDVYASDGKMNGPIPYLLGAGQTGGDADYLTNVPVAAGSEVWVFVTGGSDTEYDIDFSWTALDPKRDCLTACREMVAFGGTEDPSSPDAVVAGYFLEPEPDYLYGRRDFVMALAWAFKKTAEAFPSTNPVYVSDLSQADGQVPGTDVGEPRHPADAHINGHDADLAYYQTMPDNDYRIICGDGSDKTYNGQAGRFNDGEFCTTEQNVVDWPRQAYFLAMMADNPLYHVTGMDVTLPDQCVAAVEQLASSGKIPAHLAYRVANGIIANRQYWPFHHHHIHTQLWNPDQPRLPLYWDGYF